MVMDIFWRLYIKKLKIFLSKNSSFALFDEIPTHENSCLYLNILIIECKTI